MSETPALDSEHGGTNETLVTVGDVLQTYPLKTRERYYQYLEALALRQKGYFQKEIAARLCIDHHRVWNWLKGRCKPVAANQIASFQKLELLPFKLNLTNPKCLLILKIGFFTLGDGHIMSKRGGIILSGYPTDLNEIEEECKENDLPCWRHKDTRYLYIGGGVARILIQLGFPRGRKTTQVFLLPTWLFNSPKNIKRLLLSIIFGNEGNVHINEKYKLRTITLGLVKKEKLSQNLIDFCKQIQHLLKEFGITSHLYTRYWKGFCICSIIISDALSILNFCSKIGLLYAADKKAKLEELQKNTVRMLKSYLHYFREYENAVKTKTWNKRVSWATFYNWTKNNCKPTFYERKDEILNLLSFLKASATF